MVTGELKSKIDSLWEIFWTGGIAVQKALNEAQVLFDSLMQQYFG